MKKVILFVCCGVLLCSLKGFAKTEVPVASPVFYANAYSVPSFTLGFSLSGYPNDNGSYPQGTKLVVNVLTETDVPAGLLYEFKIEAPNGTSWSNGPQASRSTRLSLQQYGEYVIYCRIITGTGEVGEWEVRSVNVN